MASTDMVLPGQRLGSVADLLPGTGAYARGDTVYASVVGLPQRGEVVGADEPNRVHITVQREKEVSSVPEAQSIVVGSITRVNQRQATVAIRVVGSVTCRNEFTGVIRVEDVRATEKDKVRMSESFRPGDVVRAQVVSLGDAHSYTLSTAHNQLGVIHARSSVGAPMFPVSWREMRCSQTGETELRKCAKPL